MTFLEAMNRVLRFEGIIMGDDDDLTSFTASQHAATGSMARLAIQSQLADLIADQTIPFEDSDDTITTVAATRTYSLASGFIRMQELFLEKIENSEVTSKIPAYPGGETQLRLDDGGYREASGSPIYFYPIGGSTKKVGLYPVPDAVYTYRYYYESDVSVSVTSDNLPFASEVECQTFVRMAARHFKYLKATPQVREGLFPNGIESDSVILQARSTLSELMYPLPQKRRYGKRYGRT